MGITSPPDDGVCEKGRKRLNKFVLVTKPMVDTKERLDSFKPVGLALRSERRITQEISKACLCVCARKCVGRGS